MSISVETAKEHLDDPAVLCCRREKGKLIEASDLEDPTLFPDYEDSGLLELPDDVLKIGQVLGATLNQTKDALVPLTPEVVDNIQDPSAEEDSDDEDSTDDVVSNSASASSNTVTGVVNSGMSNGVLHLSVKEGKGIEMDVPLSIINQGVAQAVPASDASNQGVNESSSSTENKVDEEVVRSLTRKHFKIDKVEFGDETKIDGTTLVIGDADELCKEAIESQEIVKDMKISVITPDDYHKYTNSIMDVQPIATKEKGELGEGVTRVLDGIVTVLTGTDENGVQVGEFGSSEGYVDENVMWGRPGAIDKGEIMLVINATVQAGTNRERRGPRGAHEAADLIVEKIREALKKADDGLVVNTETIEQKRRYGNKRVLLVKEIMGQGAMHDNLILPKEPVGTLGAQANVDLGNLPIMLSPLEILDGGIHALTCIGPASKETSRHYWREPLVEEALKDEDIDVVGVCLIGSPQANTQKSYVSKRLGMWAEAMGLDGAIVTTEGFGNNHIDYGENIEAIGSRGVPVVGITYSAVQGELVTGNKYMDAIVDNNKSRWGIENEVLENNTLCQEDAIRALAMLETKMAGGKIKKPERKWNPNVKLNNIELIEKATGKKIELVENEQSLPMSEKRKKHYEKDAN
ncbi:D-proline reductase (dithiol) proprotein PrdA [Limosilactobacillus reuteri]|uniref:D-proline reductase (dithiol) proprotein PrdA n=1 Tax=Limosilactobacillus reuteri TaxID=1598 RepID=UPI000A2DF1F8|nr:D-proline reductase (dithiol) proprotein PrdA [Limosilactobacillus reuteri]OTA73478.1 D-proline reductase (dithiol) proprotein PrdA [Limosilactobacillus reuteri]OTA74236.1 D-proline reductase (dithiol) proprotein PrdA [Limosilactobacillus reuteri]OTA79986.1 D-proline reductase (dithiol) proprotein PrdA [Limosilactobacillus reuteri]